MHRRPNANELRRRDTSLPKDVREALCVSSKSVTLCINKPDDEDDYDDEELGQSNPCEHTFPLSRRRWRLNVRYPNTAMSRATLPMGRKMMRFIDGKE